MRRIFIPAIVLLVSACSPKQESSAPAEPQPEAMSFSGKPLYAKKADSLVLVKSDSLIAAIRSKAELSENDYIEIGRSLTGTERRRMAIEAYTEGISKYPNSFRLLRHRGHRYVNLRQLDNAIADLSKAEELIRSEQPVPELDATGKQTSTYQHQIWYHIGLVHFLRKDYAAAASDFEKSLANTEVKNDGRNKAGASDWLYNCYQRSGQKDKIEALLKPISKDFDIDDKNYPYFRRLLLFKGIIPPDSLIDVSKPIPDVSALTKLYGLANWYRYNGDTATANILCKKILDSNEWVGFAYAGAELDVKQ